MHRKGHSLEEGAGLEVRGSGILGSGLGFRVVQGLGFRARV